MNEAPADPLKAGKLKEELIALMPTLRAYARSLCSNPARADDLVQDTLVKALGNLHRFEFGSNFRAWLFTILRNTYFSDLRKTRLEAEDADGAHAARLGVRPSQDVVVDLDEFKRAFAMLSDDHREVLTLVGAAGMAYEEAAEICGCAVGTVKSRVNRARAKLAELLGITGDAIWESDGGVLPQGVLSNPW